MPHVFALMQQAPAAPATTPPTASGLFRYLDDNSQGIFILILCIFLAALLTQWLAWIFAKGRYSRSDKERRFGIFGARKQQNIRYIFSEAAVKIIDDFRHLLALVLVLIFGFALAFVLIQARLSVAGMKEGLQTVVATLGGLIGSIIGYYFGESSALRRDGGSGTQLAGAATTTTPVQSPPPSSGQPGAGGAAADSEAVPVNLPPGVGPGGGAGGGSSSHGGGGGSQQPGG
ncbi:MAG TPA: hypothetical protein VKB12_21300 [Pyrinomonadaceae bacterium]|nr:hypothetical protein [Pyrinomonadaceae bacterium]